MEQTKPKQNGFTLVELLVVVAIIGLLMSTISIALGSARAKSRDARRISDMRQVQTAMNLYNNHASGYPPRTEWIPNSDINCSGTFFIRVPQDPLGGGTYEYQHGGNSSAGCGGTIWSRWYVRFVTERDSDIGPGGTYYVSSEGISPSEPFVPAP